MGIYARHKNIFQDILFLLKTLDDAKIQVDIASLMQDSPVKIWENLFRLIRPSIKQYAVQVIMQDGKEEWIWAFGVRPEYIVKNLCDTFLNDVDYKRVTLDEELRKE